MNDVYHTPVLVDEVLRYLQIVPNGIYVDGTLGGGGHAERLLNGLAHEGKVIGFDVDSKAIQFAQQRLRRFGERIEFVHDNFSHIGVQLEKRNIFHVNGILLDLGVSSQHLDAVERGFSFQSESPIDMRMDQRQQFDGWNVVNRYDEDALKSIFLKYGEERNAKRIASKIFEIRKQHPINTTRELAVIVESAVGKRFLTKSLARIFQAIRIEVNNELENLRAALREAIELLAPSGRIVVISYQSLEDRIVKECFKIESRNAIPSGHKFLPDTPIQPKLKIITKKPVMAEPEEIAQNPRARSAKLRSAERI
jgi:16S rRNA (cytosine1402-N4)-methyltransferase